MGRVAGWERAREPVLPGGQDAGRLKNLVMEKLRVQYGVILPNEPDARMLADLGHAAEEAGWDGVFVWDTVFGTDVWVALTAVAMRTERVRVGPMVAPLPRRRPWKLASETATLDHLSSGRLILPVGLGAAEDERWDRLGEEMAPRVRAKLLDEGLDILTGLWSGQPFDYDGERYRVRDVSGRRPVQSPRIPIWVPGTRWPDVPATKLRRMLRWDGVLIGPRVDVRALREFVSERRSQATPFDIALEGETPGDDHGQAAAIVHPFVEAVITWWLESIGGEVQSMRTRVEQGPPR